MEREIIEDFYISAIHLTLSDLYKHQKFIKKADIHQYKKAGFYTTALDKHRNEMKKCWLFLMKGELQTYFDYEPRELVEKFYEMKGWEFDEETESSYYRAQFELRKR